VDPLTGVGTNPKKEIVRVISPLVAGSNPALGTSMGFWNKPATLLLPLPEELEIIHVADIFESILNQLLNFIWGFCHLTCVRWSLVRVLPMASMLTMCVQSLHPEEHQNTGRLFCRRQSVQRAHL